MAIAVIVYLEGTYHHPSLPLRDAAYVAAAHIATQAKLDSSSKTTAFCNLCYALDHHELLAGQRESVLLAISIMASAGLESETFAMSSQTLRRILTLPSKTTCERASAIQAAIALIQTSSKSVTAANEFTQIFISLLSGNRRSDNYDVMYPVLRSFVVQMPGGETTLRHLISGLTTATTASDAAVRHGAALGMLAIFEGCEREREKEKSGSGVRRVLQIQPEAFADVVSGCLDDDIGIRAIYIRCLKCVAIALEMTLVLKKLEKFEHTKKKKRREKKSGIMGIGEVEEEVEEGVAEEEDKEDEEAEGDNTHDEASTLILIASTSSMVSIVKDAIVEHGAILPQQQLTHLINSSEMSRLTPKERLLRMRRVSVWIPTMERIDSVLLQQLLSTLEDPHPGVFTASLEMFASLHHVLKLPENQKMMRTIYAFVAKQLEVRKKGGTISNGDDGESSSGSNSGGNGGGSGGVALMRAMVQCLTSLPLKGLEQETLSDLLETVVQLLFQPGLDSMARMALLRLVCDPSRPVSSLPWSGSGMKKSLLPDAVGVLLMGLGDHDPQCVHCCLEGIRHLNSATTIRDLTWLEEMLSTSSMVERALISDDHIDRIAAYSLLARAMAEKGKNHVKEHVHTYAQMALRSFQTTNMDDHKDSSGGGGDGGGDGGGNDSGGGGAMAPSHHVSWLCMLLRRMSPSTSNEIRSQHPLLSILSSHHGLSSRNVRNQNLAVECLVQLCNDDDLTVDQHSVRDLTIQSVSLLSSNEPHLKIGGLLLLTHIVPHHFPGVNLWIVGKSNILQTTLSMMIRSHSVNVRIASVRLIRELLLAVPSTITRSGVLHKIRSRLRECFAHDDRNLQAAVADMYPLAFYHNPNNESSNASSHFLFSDLTSDGNMRMSDPVLAMLGPRQLRSLYGATMEALGFMACSSEEGTLTIAESLRHRLRTNDDGMRAHAVRAYTYQCQRLQRDQRRRERMLFGVLPLCSDPVVEVRVRNFRFFRLLFLRYYLSIICILLIQTFDTFL